MATGPGLGLVMYIFTTLEFSTQNFDFHTPILCHFPTPIERIYYFETLTFRDSIDIYFKSTFLIFLTKPNVPTKIVNVPTKIMNVPTDQVGLKSGGGASWLRYCRQTITCNVYTLSGNLAPAT